MPTFMTVSKHTPENCPMFSEKHRKSFQEMMAKMENLTKKHGVKMIGSWTNFPLHTIYMIFEGTLDAVNKLMMEPEILGMLSWNIMETTNVVTMEEVSAMLKKAK